MINPKRQSGVLLQSVAEETLAYNPSRSECVLLPEIAGRLFERCDGETAVEELARSLELDEETALRNLGDLTQAGLIAWSPEKLSRRKFIGLGAGLTSIALVTPAAAASLATCSGDGLCFNGPEILFSDLCDCFGLSGAQTICLEIHASADCSNFFSNSDAVGNCAGPFFISAPSACARPGAC